VILSTGSLLQIQIMEQRDQEPPSFKNVSHVLAWVSW